MDCNDDKMLALNPDNPLKTGDITKGTWKGNLVASGLRLQILPVR